MEHTFTDDRMCFYSISVERNWAISWFCWIWSICLLQAHWQITHSSPLDEVFFFNLGVPFASVFCPLLHPSRRKKNLNRTRVWELVIDKSILLGSFANYNLTCKLFLRNQRGKGVMALVYSNMY